jgi:uncharacterized protein (TIGR02996 family)
MNEATLLEAIYAAPHDDAPRLVYADFLQEKGDARGEFIALQFARLRASPTAKALAREKSLLVRHRRKWTGKLWEAVYQSHELRFARGFVDDVRLNFRGRDPRRLAGHPGWSTLRTLRGSDPWTHDETFYLHDVFRWLIEWRDCRLGIVALMLADDRPRRLERLAVAEPILDGRDELTFLPPVKRALVEGRGLPALRHLELTVGQKGLAPAAFDWLWATPLGMQLETLILRLWHDQLPPLLPWQKANVVPRNLQAVQLITRDRGVVLTRASDEKLRAANP